MNYIFKNKKTNCYFDISNFKIENIENILGKENNNLFESNDISISYISKYKYDLFIDFDIYYPVPYEQEFRKIKLRKLNDIQGLSIF